MTTATTSETATRLGGPRRSSKVVWAVGTVVTLAAAVVIAWALLRPGNPSPDGDPVEIAKFVATKTFNHLPEAQKRQYMARLRGSQAEVEQAHADGRLRDREWQAAAFNISLERDQDKMDDYYQEPPGKARERFLDELIDRKLEKKRKAKPGKSAAVKTNTQRLADEAADDDSEWMEQRKDDWTEEEEARWKEFQDALEAREKARGL